MTPFGSLQCSGTGTARNGVEGACLLPHSRVQQACVFAAEAAGSAGGRAAVLAAAQHRRRLRLVPRAPQSLESVSASEARLPPLGVLCGLGGGGRPRGVPDGFGDGTEVA